MNRIATFALVAGLQVVSFQAFATDTPASLKGATLIDAAKAKALQDKGVPIYDTRVATEYAEEHIKGAINLPYKEKSKKEAAFDASQDKFDDSKLPSDKNAEIVFQCNGKECWKSYKAAHWAISKDHKKVYWFRDGFPAWKKAGLPTEK